MKIFVYAFLIIISVSPLYANDYDTNEVKKFIKYMEPIK